MANPLLVTVIQVSAVFLVSFLFAYAYYAVTPESNTAIAERILGGFVGFVLTPVGRGYIAVALGLLGPRYRDPLTDRPLTVRRAIGVAALAIPVAFVGTLVFESGSASRFVTGPTSATLVASGIDAGVLAHQRRWLALSGSLYWWPLSLSE